MIWLNKILSADSCGFTLTELSITIVVSSILILFVASLLIISNEQMIKSRIEVQDIRDHTLITQICSRIIREGSGINSKIYTDSTKTTLSSSGSCLSVTAPDSTTTSLFTGNNDFVLVKTNGVKNRLVKSIVNNLSFSEFYNPDSLRTIRMVLTTNQNGSPLTTTQYYSFRN
ncbi:MAG: prepilin-type N-terminal cleavage/methylation domain-containing protein [Candidatus Marinimicrobia bacterium]|nr:prepilin-type N-terminal cleavage/methylation domain-containing protein [Candidatus Neomarinimicrobiota bacterium]